MKTSITTLGGRCTAPATLLVLIAACLVSRGADAPKDHVLFVGSDFGVVANGTEHSVTDAGDRTFVYQDRGKRREVPLSQLPDIRIHRGLKLTNVTATIDHLEAVLSSDAGNADRAESTLTAMAMAMRGDIKRDMAVNQMLIEDMNRLAVGSSDPTSPNAGSGVAIAFIENAQKLDFQQYAQVEAQHTQDFKFIHQTIETTGAATAEQDDEVELTPELNAGTAGLSVSGQLPKPRVSVVRTSPQHATKTIVDAGEGRADHLDLTFEVSAAHPLDHAYVVVTAEYTAPKSETIYRRVITQRVGRIASTPKKIHLYSTNFPEGFHLRTNLVSLYANGQEIATNLSETRMVLSRDEAYEYIATDYLATHQGKSAPPAAVLMTPRSELAGSLEKSAAWRQPVYVSVDDNGVVTGLSDDPKRPSAPSADVVAALQNFRFIPALNNGKPIAGRAKIVLADFVQ